MTAKLSLKFYEKLGEDVANELVEWFNQVDATYRADLRELNELNFARFDAKLEQRIAEVKAEIAGAEQRFGERVRSLESRLEVGLASLRADMVKWLFGMWITLLGAMVALTKLG